MGQNQIKKSKDYVFLHTLLYGGMENKWNDPYQI